MSELHQKQPEQGSKGEREYLYQVAADLVVAVLEGLERE